MNRKMLVVFALLISAIPACNTSTSSTIPTPMPRQAILSNLENEVLARDVTESDWQNATDGDSIQQGGGSETKDAARARLDITDGTIVRLGPNSLFELKVLTPSSTDPQTRFFLEAGKLWVAVTKSLGQGSFEIETPAGVSGVRGSLMSTEYTSSGQMIVTCIEGECYLSDLNGNSVDLKPGEQSEILDNGGTPTPPHPMAASVLDDWVANFPEAAAAVQKIKTTPQAQNTQAASGTAIFNKYKVSTITQFPAAPFDPTIPHPAIEVRMDEIEVTADADGHFSGSGNMQWFGSSLTSPIEGITCTIVDDFAAPSQVDLNSELSDSGQLVLNLTYQPETGSQTITCQTAIGPVGGSTDQVRTLDPLKITMPAEGGTVTQPHGYNSSQVIGSVTITVIPVKDSK